MTPKEKAIEIVEKYQSGYVSNGFNYQLANDLTDAKHCGFITVNEILFALNDINGEYNMANFIDWWEEVKEEIEKL